MLSAFNFINHNIYMHLKMVLKYSPDASCSEGVITTVTTRGPQVTGRECVLEVFSFFFFGKQYLLQELLFHYRPLTLTEFPLWKDPEGQ